MQRDITANKHGGNQASIEAYKLARRTQSAMCQLLLGWIVSAPDGLTSKEIRKRLNKERPRKDGEPWALGQFSGRLTDLRDAKLVHVLELDSETTERRDGAEVLRPVRDGKQAVMFQEVA